MAKNDWTAYKELFLYEMKENGKRFTIITDALGELRDDVAALKVKAAIVGGIAGIVGTGIVTAVLSAFK
jgi:hypothetical protein